MPEASENFPNVTPVSSVDTGNPARPPTWEKFIGQAMADYESPLIGYASSILNDIDLARDVVQDTFIRLCQQDISKVRHGLKSWLFTVCRNRALDVLRKNQRLQPLEDLQWRNIAGPDLQPDEQADRKELSSRLETYLDRLSPNQREVILLKFQQGLSYQEIREITGLRTGNIGFIIHTGLKRLREILPDDVRL